MHLKIGLNIDMYLTQVLRKKDKSLVFRPYLKRSLTQLCKFEAPSDRFCNIRPILLLLAHQFCKIEAAFGERESSIV